MESFLLKGNLCLDRYVKVVAPITGPRNGCSNTYEAPVTFQMDASNAWGNIGYLFRNQFDSMCLQRYSTSSGYLLYPHNLLPNLLVLLCLKNSRQMSSSSGMMSGKAWGCLKHCPMSYGTPSQQPLRRWLRVGMHDLMMRLPSYRFGSVLYGGYRMTLDVLTSLRNGFLSNGCSETFRTLRRPGRILMPSWKQREKLTKLSPAPQSMRCWPNVTKSSARSHRGWNALNLMLAHRECHVLPPSPRTSGTKRTSWVKSCTLRYFNLKRPHMFQFWLDRRGKESSSWCTCLQDGGGLETSTGGWIRLLINGFPATTSGLPPTIRPLTPFWGIWREQLWAAGEPRRMWGDIGPVLAARPAKPSARRGTLSLQLSWKPVGPGPFAVRPPFGGSLTGPSVNLSNFAWGTGSTSTAMSSSSTSHCVVAWLSLNTRLIRRRMGRAARGRANFTSTTLATWSTQVPFGAPTVKPTVIRAMGTQEAKYEMHRHYLGGIQKPTKKLPGIDDTGQFCTAAAKEYPTAMSKGLAFSVAKTLACRLKQGQRFVQHTEIGPLFAWVSTMCVVSKDIRHDAVMMPDYQR